MSSAVFDRALIAYTLSLLAGTAAAELVLQLSGPALNGTGIPHGKERERVTRLAERRRALQQR
jgi:hypothetical protein